MAPLISFVGAEDDQKPVKTWRFWRIAWSADRPDVVRLDRMDPLFFLFQRSTKSEEHHISESTGKKLSELVNSFQLCLYACPFLPSGLVRGGFYDGSLPLFPKRFIRIVFSRPAYPDYALEGVYFAMIGAVAHELCHARWAQLHGPILQGIRERLLYAVDKKTYYSHPREIEAYVAQAAVQARAKKVPFEVIFGKLTKQHPDFAANEGEMYRYYRQHIAPKRISATESPPVLPPIGVDAEVVKAMEEAQTLTLQIEALEYRIQEMKRMRR